MQNRKFFLIAPLIVMPFLFVIFSSLGGGGGKSTVANAGPLGINTELPAANIDPKQALLNKMAFYLRADADSARKKESEQRDPYHPYIVSPKNADSTRKDSGRVNPRADELLRQLDRLKQSLRQPEPPRPAPIYTRPWQPPAIRTPVVDTPVADPQIEKLNTMLDKVIRIQHPAENKTGVTNTDKGEAEALLPADSGSNAIAAIIPVDQTLVAGQTIALRLSEDVVVHGVQIAQGQWIYGVVTINSDRMLVHIRSIHYGRNLYSTDLQVYDLDGLPGIHIPGMLSRDVAKESADEGVNGLNVMAYDPSLGAQAATAGVQAAKSMFSRKVRIIRVSVRAGYQVLLRDNKAFAPVRQSKALKDSLNMVSIACQPPGALPAGSFLQRSRSEGMELDLRGIYLKDDLLWFWLRWQNHSPIDFVPSDIRWFIRDRRSFKRTAEQELTIEPVNAPGPVTIAGDSCLNQWTGLHSFTPGKGKELVLEAGEKNGGRVIQLVISPHALLKAKRE
jgi:Conjugative transposon, TraM/Domain of unknown function (DUF4138)